MFFTVFIYVSIFGDTINIPLDLPTIQAGIDTSVDGDTVIVHPGIYNENINFKGKLIVLGSLFLSTGDTSYISSTIIDGNSLSTVVTFNSQEDSTCKLAGLTIQNGKSKNSGGGILCFRANPVIESNIIKDNHAMHNGGGISCQSYCRSLVIDNTFENNQADKFGGGIYSWCSEPLLIANEIKSNYAMRGGGIYCEFSFPKICDNKVTDNAAQIGGGISSIGSSPDFSNNIFKGNLSGVYAVKE
jgi:hypothetical protein